MALTLGLVLQGEELVRLVEQVVYSILPHRYSNLTYGEVLVVQRVDGG